ncbi:MAG TPA: hypothetical protein VI298_04280 [Geobacteraceae bacterium]
MEKERNKRLCSEIQLFDLCDRDVCSHKDGRYCTKGDILARFEAITDEEDDRSPEQFMADELDELEGADDLGYDEAYAVDEYGEADECDEDEDI